MRWCNGQKIKKKEELGKRGWDCRQVSHFFEAFLFTFSLFIENLKFSSEIFLIPQILWNKNVIFINAVI